MYDIISNNSSGFYRREVKILLMQKEWLGYSGYWEAKDDQFLILKNLNLAFFFFFFLLLMCREWNGKVFEMNKYFLLEAELIISEIAKLVGKSGSCIG